MAYFGPELQSYKPSQLFSEMDMNTYFTNQFGELNPSMLESFNNTNFSAETFLTHQQPEFPSSFTHNLQNTFLSDDVDGLNAVPVVHTITSNGDVCDESKKRKVMEQSKSSCSENISSTTSNAMKNNSLRKRKKGRSNEKEVDKQEEVIHVRARRGQATDSHSVAERVRREKINNRLRCLQDLVPGCYKTKGMAVMLDEIINYVHSLQNQVEFLSMELAAASTSSHDFNLETEATDKGQGTNTHEAQEIEKMLMKGYGEHSCFHSTWPL